MQNDVQKLQKEIKKLEDRREELFDLKKSIDEEIVFSDKKLEKLKNNLDIMVAKPKDWDWLLKIGSTARFEMLEKALEDCDITVGCNYAVDDQHSIQIALYQKKSLEKTLRGLEELLPHIRPWEDGFKYVSIFEHSLSKNGSYALKVGEKFSLIKSTHKNSTIKTFKNLKTALEYIQKHHYYK